MMAQKVTQDSVKEDSHQNSTRRRSLKGEVSVLLLNNFYKHGDPTLKKKAFMLLYEK